VHVRACAHVCESVYLCVCVYIDLFVCERTNMFRMALCVFVYCCVHIYRWRCRRCSCCSSCCRSPLLCPFETNYTESQSDSPTRVPSELYVLVFNKITSCSISCRHHLSHLIRPSHGSCHRTREAGAKRTNGRNWSIFCDMHAVPRLQPTWSRN